MTMASFTYIEEATRWLDAQKEADPFESA